jgi:hypothetical protein
MMSSEGATLRTKFGLSVVPANQITLVTDNQVCARAGAAADSVMTVWDPSDPPVATTNAIYVIQVGTAYAVVDLNDPSPNPKSEFSSVFIFGPLWDYRGIVEL